MTNIKCRYSFPYCSNIERKDDEEDPCVFYDRGGLRVNLNEYYDCRSKEACPFYERPDDAEAELVNPRCEHFYLMRGEFEKNVKNYDYFDGDLKVAGNTYEYRDIDYLEIDGRVLRDDTEEN